MYKLLQYNRRQFTFLKLTEFVNKVGINNLECDEIELLYSLYEQKQNIQNTIKSEQFLKALKKKYHSSTKQTVHNMRKIQQFRQSLTTKVHQLRKQYENKQKIIQVVQQVANPEKTNERIYHRPRSSQSSTLKKHVRQKSTDCLKGIKLILCEHKPLLERSKMFQQASKTKYKKKKSQILKKQNFLKRICIKTQEMSDIPQEILKTKQNTKRGVLKPNINVASNVTIREPIINQFQQQTKRILKHQISICDPQREPQNEQILNQSNENQIPKQTIPKIELQICDFGDSQPQEQNIVQMRKTIPKKKVLDVMFWVKPFMQKFQYQKNVYEEETHIAYQKIQQNASQLRPETNNRIQLKFPIANLQRKSYVQLVQKMI